ncbi:hypothetical protein ACJMK2_041686 [Sinanodonta woodiana]|uniref:Uncharacterized protein n=1 Tax=Sinanodonta woodiana TaxID=1069815 RepID=A0ABD3W509_SINWO
MATLTMEQDTDLKRFIEDRKQRYYDNDKAAVFATSLPLSNNGVEDRRSQLRDERHRDYQRYLERFGQQYQKAGDEHIENPFLPPPGAMPKSPAKREVQQQRMDRKYDQKYDQILQETEQKHQDESDRNRTRYSPSRPQVPPQPRPGDIDYSQMKQELADERKRDYQDYLQQQEHMYVRAQQENGIPVLDRTPKEENSYVTSKPPPGPGAYRQRDEPTRQTPHYWDEGRPVRSPQSYDSQPGQRNDPAEHAPQSQAPHGAPPAQHSPRRTPLALQTGYRPSTPSDPRRGKPLPNPDFPYGYGYEEMRKKAIGERKKDYQEYVKRESEKYRPHADELPPPGPSDFPKGHHYNSDEYEKYRKDLQQKQHAEYQDFLQKKNQQAPDRTWKDLGDNAQGLILGDTKHENQKKLLNDERRREYNEHLAQQKELPQPKRTWPEPEGRGALLLKQGEYENLRKKYADQRRMEFLGSLERNVQLRAKQAARREGFTPRDAVEETPVVNALGHYEDFEQKLREERKMETEKFILEQKNRSYHSPYENFMYPTVAHAERPLVENLGSNYQLERRKLAEERKRDFELYLEKKQMSDPPRFGRNTPPVVGPYSGIFAGLGQYDLDKQRLKKERQSEYSNYLDKTYAEKGRPYGRPTWAKDIDDGEQYPARPYSYEHRSNPETKPRDHLPPIEGQGLGDRRPPSYEDMLAKNRQKEADRRRYDPGFAPRDDRYEAERNGPVRDGDYAPRDGGYGGDGNQNFVFLILRDKISTDIKE